MKALFDAAEKAFGAPADVLVNNAGVYGETPLGSIDEAGFRKYFELNVLGLLQEAVGRLNSKQGVVINLSSAVALTPAPGMSVYLATKAAVDNITRGLALELGPKARASRRSAWPDQHRGTSGSDAG